MRSSKSRSRSKSNRNRSVGNVVNRVFDSSGPEGKVRGTPQQIIDKYNQMARDSLLGNDRVATENFQQHAEHYVRMLGQAQREADARREQQEAQNRERQREREEARAAEQQSHGSRDGFSAPVDADPAKTEQPDIAEPPVAEPAHVQSAEPVAAIETVDIATDGDSGLVETPESAPSKPESKPRAPRRPRKPKVVETEVKENPAPAGDDNVPNDAAE